MSKHENPRPEPKYPGERTAVDGSEAVVAMETAASEGAGAYPITPSTQMGEGWAVAMAAGKTNVDGRRLLFFEPEGEHAAAAVTAGMNLVGLRATNFSSGQGVAYMHESLYAAVGKRLTYVLNVACRAMTKHSLNVHAGHDDYHAVDDTGFFQVFGKDVQETADLNLIAHRIAELSLNPGLVAQDGFLTSHVIENVLLPERELIKEYLGSPADTIDSPTPAQRLVFGEQRRRIPELYDLDYPAMLGTVQNQDSYAQGVAAQRPFYFDHVAELTDQAMDEYAALTGRRYARAMGYRLDDAVYVIAGQGSMIANAEALCDWARRERGLKLGVLNLTMFRPFPADLVTHLLKGKKAVTVLERLDQPLAVDAPLLREIRAAMGQALENGRARGEDPHPGVASCKAGDVPEFFSGCFGMGSRDLQPGDLLAAVDNMVDEKRQRRQFYLGIDFVRKDTRMPKLQIWQDQLLDGYPHLGELALESAGDIDVLPEGTISIRIHSIGGWGAITMGKNVALTVSELLGLYIKANPKYGSEKKGQPTTFYATLARQPIRTNCELKHVNVVLSPDSNVFRHSNPLAGLAKGGVFIIQSDLDPQELWNSLPKPAQRDIRENEIKLFTLDAFKIATAEATDADLRYRMQGTAFMGAFFRASPLMRENDLDEQTLLDGIRKQLTKKFGHLGERVVEDNLRVIRRGFDETREVDLGNLEDAGTEAGAGPQIPALLDRTGMCAGIAHTGRFWEQVGYLYASGQEILADPFAALSAIPAATSSLRDMTDVRFEVPKFIAEKCTGCAQCWTQCPDSAIPGVVNTVEEVLEAALNTVENGHSLDRMRQATKHVANEARRILKATPFTSFPDVLSLAYDTVAGKLASDPERRAALDKEFAPVAAALAEFPLTKTAPFFDLPEGQEKGTGGLLSITVNPETCKGCNICVDVCPDGALVTVKQDDEIVESLRRNWKLWRNLPDTDDRYVNIASLEEAIGVLPSLLLKKENYLSMVGGDGSCMGCGEKTAIHLVLAAIHAQLLPRVAEHVKRLDELIEGLDTKARGLVASDADLETLDVPVDDEKKADVQRIASMIRDLKDLKWRYTEGPSGNGRAAVGFTNATGCSSVWGSTYPYNPYPFPWVNHLFQDAPSIAIGIFDGHMRKMSDGFIAVRRAALELAGEYDPAVHEPFFTQFEWKQFSDEEFGLCPPICAVGGDGAMMDIGFQNLSRMLASGKPIRALVLDTQVYSNTGGQACTSGYTGQVSDMAAFGAAHHGKEEVRKELALIAIAHRGTYVLQSSQGMASHLLGGVLKGLQSRRPAVFLLHSPCPPEHGIADDAATQASKLAVESRAFPLLTYDPDEGATISECIDLDGNPEPGEAWPSYDLAYVDDEEAEQTMELPLTIADWAASEGRFKKHFRPADPEAELVPFHEYVAQSPEDREDGVPFIYVIGEDRHLERVEVSREIVALAEDRQSFWRLLRDLAGAGAEDGEFAQQAEELRAEYEAKLAQLKSAYPRAVARRMAEGLLRGGNGGRTIADILQEAQGLAGIAPVQLDLGAPAGPAPGRMTQTAVAEPAVADEAEEGLALEPYIETLRCTTCDECTRLNKRMFAYNEKKQAYIKDAKAGTFRDLVQAAEKCPVKIIHPGTPLNPKEKNLAKWVKRAEPFN
ncbi:MAG: 2-oxoacid:acceptor oxidoreductase family protein [Planctomycetota bacterium]|jgi:pyruvate-ferredoxin/flavodoxin oxidoreductase